MCPADRGREKRSEQQGALGTELSRGAHGFFTGRADKGGCVLGVSAHGRRGPLFAAMRDSRKGVVVRQNL